jgi:hypothetical protein
MREVRCILMALVALAASASPMKAQGSVYVPLDDPAYVYIDALQSRGYLRTLPLLERPHTASAIVRAIAADSSRLIEWHRKLAERVALLRPQVDAVDDSSLRVMVAPGLRAVAQTSGQRELMRADSSSGAFPGASVRAAAAGGNVIAAARLMADNRLGDDPEFVGKTDRWVRGRMEEAYIAGQWRLGELFFGRMTRNWGPPELQGLQVGSAAYSYDHAFLRFGPDAFHVSSIVARLEPYGTTQRYLAVHRLAGRLGNVELAAAESYLYTGAGRGMSFSLSNPLNLYNLAQYNEAESGNVAYSLEGAWRGPLLVSAQLFVDDFQVDDCDPMCQEPSSLGYTVSFRGIPLPALHRAFASYTRVSNLVYRTPDSTERYASFGVSLGRAFADYDELRAGVDVGAVRLPPVQVYVAYRRQGEGDYRRPFPAPSEYASTPGFLAGRVERVARLALSGRSASGDLSVSWDVGVNRHSISGVSRTDPEGRVAVSWEPSWARLSGVFR